MILRGWRFFKNGELHLYSTLLLLSTFVWMELPYNSGIDMNIQKFIEYFKIGFTEIKPPVAKILVVDVATSRYLLPTNNDSTENNVVVNRRYLTELFKLIASNKNNVKYVFTDVIFDQPTSDDRQLRKAITMLGNKFLCVDTYNNEGNLVKNVLQVRSATAAVALQSGAVYKIPFTGSFNDTLAPAKLYLDLQKGKFTSNFLFTWFTGRGLAFNTQINDYYLRERDLENSNYVKIGLGELVSLSKITPTIFDQYIKDRYILIGDFDNDKHETYLNSQPGTLIIFNAYWHLKNGQHILSFGYLIALYFFLYVVVWLQTSKWTFTHELKLKIPGFETFLIPINIISISVVIVVFTCLSALVGVNVSLFHLVGIFSIVDAVLFLKKNG